MKKLTKILINIAHWNDPPVVLKAEVYGDVNNGVTTITSIKNPNSVGNFYSTRHTDVTPDYFPAYIKIDGTSYKWIIDSLDSDGNVQDAHADIGSKITINNIFFSNTYGIKGNEEYYVYKNNCFYDFSDTSKFPTNWPMLIPSSLLQLYSGSGIIDGKNTFSATYNFGESTYAGETTRYGLLYTGEVYRFTWKLGKRTHNQNVVADTEYSISSGDFTIPIEWCDQLTAPDGSYFNPKLELKFSFFIDGKTIEEWNESSYGGGNSYLFELQSSCSVDADPGLVPSISSVTLADTNGVVPSSWKEYVQSLSNVAISEISCSGAVGSTIATVQLKVKDTTVDGTLSSLPKTSVIREYGTFDVDVTVRDSRNRTATKSSKITFLSYSAPTISAVVSRRCTENGIIDNDGTFVKVSGTPNVYSCNGKNSYHVYVSYKRTNESTYSPEQEVTLPATIGTKDATTKLGNFDPEYSYDIRYRITDAINSVYYVDYVSTVIMMMHFMRGGRGVAFGQKATVEYCVDTSFNALFRGNVGFEINKKFYTIEQIINALNITGVDSLSWVENNKKEF